MARQRSLAASLAFVCASLSGCVDEAELVDGLYTEAEWARISELSPLPAPPEDPSNKFADDPDAAVLGQMFYFEKSITAALVVGDDGSNGGFGEVGEEDTHSCEGCHSGPWFDDQRSMPNNVSLGVDWGTRNSPPVVNSAFYEWFYWDGRADSLWAQALGAAGNGVQQKATRLGVAHAIYDKYRSEYEALTGDTLPDYSDIARFPLEGSPKKSEDDADGDWESMTAEDQEATTRIFVNFGKAIAAYERLLVSGNSPFDRYVGGENDAISTSAKRGLLLFVGKANCVECHNTPAFTDNDFHNVGVPQAGEHIPAEDTGRYGAIPKALGATFNVDSEWSDDRNTGKRDEREQTEDLRAQFRTKHLRQVAHTGPYMHTGGLATLREVVEFYNGGGGESDYDGEKDSVLVPLNLSDSEIDDLVAFLESLTGEEPPAALLEDTSRP
jgi:cytochrome c peroxidase